VAAVSTPRRCLRSLLGHQPPASLGETTRACAGAFLGLLVVGVVTRAAFGPASGLPLLLAATGASAVLVFAVPASPLAQPWPVVGGGVVSALVGVAASRLVDDRTLAAALAGAAALGAMGVLRCLHPPGAAIALTAVLGGPAVLAKGWAFALMPVGVNAVLLVGVGLVVNAVNGHPYPHVAERHAPVATMPEDLHVTEADVEAALADYSERLDVDREDVVAVFESAFEHAAARAGR
jgi:CBS domain-containing membrane protein